MVYIAAAESGVRMEPESMAVPGNSIPLSPTSHSMWDNGHFSLFPLKVSEGQWRLHCLFMRPLQKMVRLHHRRPVRRGMANMSPACAWARFVLSVCQIYESVFLTEQTRRKLGGSKIEAQWVEADQILQQRLERQGSENPRKRGRSQLRDDSSDGAA
jgi:hypothetical protein